MFFEDVATKEQLFKLLDSFRTKNEDKTIFWKELKQNKQWQLSTYLDSLNTLINIRADSTRELFVDEYKKRNNPLYAEDIDPETFDFCSVGIPVLDVNLSEFTSLKQVYKAIAESLCDPLGKNLNDTEAMFERIATMINKLMCEIVIINYTSDELLSSKKNESILFNLVLLSEICKVSIHVVGKVSYKLFYREKRDKTIGSYISYAD